MIHSNNLKSDLQAALEHSGASSSDFDLNPELVAPSENLREAAVLVAFQNTQNGAEIVLTKRSSALKHHPGQIAFPGGKRDSGDDNLAATAIREAEEEISLPAKSVHLLGTLPPHITVTNFNVTPYVGWIDAPAAFEIETGEVAEVFTVPAAHLLKPGNFRIEGRMWRGQIRRYYTVPFGPYYIWGATARMLHALAQRMER
ncbi:MAG: CoA pyrophosphatase [Litoreibacter sp.]